MYFLSVVYTSYYNRLRLRFIFYKQFNKYIFITLVHGKNYLIIIISLKLNVANKHKFAILTTSDSIHYVHSVSIFFSTNLHFTNDNNYMNQTVLYKCI